MKYQNEKNMYIKSEINIIMKIKKYLLFLQRNQLDLSVF